MYTARAWNDGHYAASSALVSDPELHVRLAYSALGHDNFLPFWQAAPYWPATTSGATPRASF